MDLWSLVTAFPWRSLLDVSALILSIVNGFMLFRSYVRDRPRLSVKPVYPEVYQWFFKLPSEPFEGQPTTKFGFLAYLDILNRGLRDVTCDAWNLCLQKPDGGKVGPLNPLSIVEPRILLGKSTMPKTYPVLGQRGEFSTGEMMVKSGDSISGFAYYIFEYVGGTESTVIRSDGTVMGNVIVTDIFGKSASEKIVFREITLDRARSLVTGIENADAEMERKLQDQ